MNKDNELNDLFVLKGPVGEIPVPEKDPFKYDKLGRKDYIIKLTDVVLSYRDGVVFALNGAWGSGKTTFIRMWKQYLMNQGVPVAYYNAWVDDISDEPLYSLLKQLNKVVGKNDKKRKKVFTIGAKLLTKLGFGALKGALGPLGNLLVNMGEEVSKDITDMIKKAGEKAGEEGLKGIQEMIEDSLEEESNTASLMKDFRKVFQDYVKKDKSNKKAMVPLVYFVDELDRCSPTFAVKVLERIKHLFEVENVVFVLSIDKQQLAHSINGYFGSDLFDSMEYLRRFIGVEYYLPEPDPEDYFNHLIEHYGFGQFQISLMVNKDLKKDLQHENYLALIKLIMHYEGLNLRQVEKIFMLVRFQFNNNRIGTPHTMVELDFSLSFYLAYLKICHYDIYTNIRKLNYSLQELAEEIERLMPFKLIYKTDHNSNEIKLFSMNMILFLLDYSFDIHHRANIADSEDISIIFNDVSELNTTSIKQDMLEQIRKDNTIVYIGLQAKMDTMDLFDR